MCKRKLGCGGVTVGLDKKWSMSFSIQMTPKADDACSGKIQGGANSDQQNGGADIKRILGGQQL
jgi:hypothetical protein